MKISLVVLLFATLFVGCGGRPVSTQSSSAATLAGSYYRGDHTGYNIYLDLLANGSYTAKWRGCLGEYGTARGTWATTGGKVVLSPSEETDMMKGLNHKWMHNSDKEDLIFEGKSENWSINI